MVHLTFTSWPNEQRGKRDPKMDNCSYPGHALEERWAFDVCGGKIPWIEYSLWRLQLIPALVACGNSRVNLLEHGRNHMLLFNFLNRRTGGPNVPQVYRISTIITYNRFKSIMLYCITGGCDL